MPQPPQFVPVFVVTQTPLQQSCPDGQPVTHAPCVVLHTWHCVGSQGAPRQVPPQMRSFGQHVLPSSVSPWGQPQLPLTQTRPDGQTMPQPPQFVVEVFVLTQVPLQS